MQLATYQGEDIAVWFTAPLIQCDYGVDRSPTWAERGDVEIDAISILGVDCPVDSLPKDVQDAICKLGEEMEWTECES